MAWSKIDDGSEGKRHHRKHVRKDARPCSSLQRINKSGTTRGTCCMCWVFQPALDIESAHGHAGKVRLGSPQVAVAVLCPRKSSGAPATSRDQGVATRTRLSSQPRVLREAALLVWAAGGYFSLIVFWRRSVELHSYLGISCITWRKSPTRSQTDTKSTRTDTRRYLPTVLCPVLSLKLYRYFVPCRPGPCRSPGYMSSPPFMSPWFSRSPGGFIHTFPGFITDSYAIPSEWQPPAAKQDQFFSGTDWLVAGSFPPPQPTTSSKHPSYA